MNRNYLKFIAGLLIFGTNGVVAGNIGLDSFSLVLLKTLIGSIVMLLICGFSKNKLELAKTNRKHFFFLAVSGAALGLSWVFLYEAYRQIGVGTATLIYYCGPMIVVALSPVLFHEKADSRVYACIAVVMGGMALINLRQLSGSGMNRAGLMLGVLAALMFAVMMAAGRKAESIRGLKKSALQLVFSFAAAAVFVLPRYGLELPSTASEWGWILFMGIVNTGAGCYLYFSTLNMLPVRTVSVVGYLEPLSAVLFSVMLLHESFGILEALGAALILGGAAAAECGKLPSRSLGRVRTA